MSWHEIWKDKGVGYFCPSSFCCIYTVVLPSSGMITYTRDLCRCSWIRKELKPPWNVGRLSKSSTTPPYYSCWDGATQGSHRYHILTSLEWHERVAIWIQSTPQKFTSAHNTLSKLGRIENCITILIGYLDNIWISAKITKRRHATTLHYNSAGKKHHNEERWFQ